MLASSSAFLRAMRGRANLDAPTLIQRMRMSWATTLSSIPSFDLRVRTLEADVLPMLANGDLLQRTLEQDRNGVSAAMKLREDLAVLLKDAKSLSPQYTLSTAALHGLDSHLRKWLRTVFCLSSLRLKRVEFGTSSGDILEHVAKGESVHKVRTLRELKRRLHDGRRCIAFFHECLPEDPLVFIHIGLTTEIAPSLSALDTFKSEDTPTCAMFYSVNSPHNSLGGLDLATLLIKEAAAEIMRKFPSIVILCTLSPIPNLTAWLEGSRFNEEVVKNMPKKLQSQIQACIPLFNASAHSDVSAAAIAAVPTVEGQCVALVKDVVRAARHTQSNPALLENLREPLLFLCTQYLLQEKLPNGLPLDPVTRFHIRNGAVLHSVNWMGNPSAGGLGSSLGMMVNYLYDFPKLSENAAGFLEHKQVPASTNVSAILECRPADSFVTVAAL